MLVAEDLLLLLTDDASGKFVVDRTGMGLALAGACVLELAERGRVGVAVEGEAVRRGRLVVRDPVPTGDAVLDLATPDPRSASLAALLSALNAAHKVIAGPDKRAVKRRATEIREGQWAADAVGAAIQAVQTAVSAAVMTSVIASSAASSGGSS